LDWWLGLRWFLATVLPFLLAGFGGYFFFEGTAELINVILGVIIVGILQWLMLRNLRITAWWIPATANAWAAALGGMVFLLALFAFGGSLYLVLLLAAASVLLMGTWQWLMLRNKINDAVWWIPVTFFACILLPLYGFITGVALVLLVGDKDQIGVEC